MIQNTLPVGSTLKGAVVYTIAEHLHNGGFGITYRATAQIMVGNIPQTATFTIKEFFMSKICSRDADGSVVVATENQQAFKYAKADFKTEAEILHSLKHSNVVPVNEVFEQNNTVYYVMSYLGNVSLYQYVAENGGLLSEAKAKQIIMPLTSALAYLHNRNILHLDIKPDNIMMVGQGDVVKPVLIDFGQAMYFVNGKPKKDKGIRGYSKGYSPLEQKQNVCTFSPSLDIYSLAATLLYMLSGKDPCDAEEQSVHKIYRALPESLSQNMVEGVVCGLQKDAANRPKDIASFQNILLHGKPSTDSHSSADVGGGGAIQTDAILPDNHKSLPITKIVVSVACVAALALGGWFAFDRMQSKSAANEEWQAEQELDSIFRAHHEKKKIDIIVPHPHPAKEDETDMSNSNNVEQKEQTPASSKPSPSSDPSPAPSPKPTPSQKTASDSSPKSGTVNLGYATWTGGLLNGKPHGKGTMKFNSSHAVSGCSMMPQAGDYIIGYCENGVVQNGGLYRDGKKIDTVIR